jgi:uncharacterized OB-fold protein
MTMSSQSPASRRHYAGRDSRELSIATIDEEGVERLAASRCTSCSDTRYPPRRLCPSDLTEAETIALSGLGQVYEAVLVALAPQGYTAPYWVGYVDMPEGVRVFAQLRPKHENGEPTHGDTAELALDEVAIDADGGAIVGPVFYTFR